MCDGEAGETLALCPQDCTCNANGQCEPWEDADNCPNDCASSCTENGLGCINKAECCSNKCDDKGKTPTFLCKA
eukprot:scaffold348462_cov62-Attheya_sp.AAC.9